MSGNQEQDEWIARVLGGNLARSGPPRVVSISMAEWQKVKKAREERNQQPQGGSVVGSSETSAPIIAEKYDTLQLSGDSTGGSETGAPSSAKEYDTLQLSGDSIGSGSGSSTGSSTSGSSWDSSSSSDSADDIGGGASHELGVYAELPEGVDLSEAKLGASIKSGSFGSVSWVDGAKGTPPLIIKIPKPGKQAELEHEEEYYARIGTHPNIATCLGMQKVGGKEGLVVEGIKGRDMHGVMNRLELLRNADPRTARENGMDRALSHEEYVGTMQYMLRETLKGLAHLEEMGVVHSDIRPDNIMCDGETGAVKIVDLGLAFEADQPIEKRIAPIGHGMVSPEQATEGTTITSKADVFAAGELARLSMEGDQFRYNNNDPSRKPSYQDAREFGEKDGSGKDKQALNPMRAPESPPEGEDDDPVEPGERVDDLMRRIRRWEDDPLQKDNPQIRQLETEVQSLSRRMPDVDSEEFDELEQRMEVAERSFRTTGTYGAITSYTEFVNWAMNPDASKRPSAKEALDHPYLKDALLDDAGAQAVLKQLAAPKPNAPQTIPLDSFSDSDSSSWSDSIGSSTGSSLGSSTGSSLGSSTGSGSISIDESQPHRDERGRITKRVEGNAYALFLTEDGTWSEDPRKAKIHPPETDGSISGLGEGSTTHGEGKRDKEGRITKRDEDGYAVWLTEDGTWTRNVTQAKVHPPEK